jgi:hypothetical protein
VTNLSVLNPSCERTSCHGALSSVLHRVVRIVHSQERIVIRAVVTAYFAFGITRHITVNGLVTPHFVSHAMLYFSCILIQRCWQFIRQPRTASVVDCQQCMRQYATPDRTRPHVTISDIVPVFSFACSTRLYPARRSLNLRCHEYKKECLGP